jgi:hypothetical protein
MRFRLPRLWRALWLVLATHAAVPLHAAPTDGAHLARLEAAGVRINEVRILNRNIFDIGNPDEDKLLFRWANALHVRTRAGVIERILLFKAGEPLAARLIEESERLLRGTGFLQDVEMRVVPVREGLVDVEVLTRDTWTLEPGVTLGRSGGENSRSVSLREYNLAGTGIQLGIGRSTDVDRSASDFQLAGDRLFGSELAGSLVLSSNSDGERRGLRLAKPFRALDSRWAAGVAVSRDDRIDSVYNAGEVISQYRHREHLAEAHVGWSAGLADGWVKRYTVGVGAREDAFGLEPGKAPPVRLPGDETLVAPFVRVDLIEDRFEKTSNLSQIGRPEFLAMGLAASLQLGRALRSLGSSSDPLLYQASLGRGFEPMPRHRLLTLASVSGRLVDGHVDRQRVSLKAQYFLPQPGRWLFYGGVSADAITRPGVADTLLLGGDNGLRGYPLRYQAGTRRVLLTLEERYYTDQFWWQLLRVGGAVFADVGRAWGGDNINRVNPGWLGNVGVGLRLFNVRSAFISVIHLDVAVPINPDPGMSRVQFLIHTRASF